MKNLISILLLSLCFSCKDSIEPGQPHPIQYPTFFLIEQNNTRLSDQVLDRLRIFYLQENKKNYIADFARGTDGYDTLGIMASTDISTIGVTKGIKDFFLEYPSGDLDTLFSKYQDVQNKDSNGNLYTSRTLVELKFNTKVVPQAKDIYGQLVYVLEK